MFKTLLGFANASSTGADLIVVKNNIILFAICIIACLPVVKIVKKIKEKMLKYVYGTIAVNFIDVIYQVGMLLVCITCLVGSTYNPFLYFRF